MLASSRQPLAARVRQPSASPFAEGEGRACEASREATRSLLLPDGRPGAWLLLLAGACGYVVAHALMLRFA